jgi:cell division protein FtsA
MFDSSNIIVGLEIGTSKVCAVVGDVNDKGALNVVGIGQAKSRGVRKGEIIDAKAVEEDVRSAIAEAEQMANVEIRSVYLGVTGGHIRSFDNRGSHPIASADREISEEDVQDAVKNAKAVNLPQDHHALHSIRQHFIVDGQQGVTNPVGMLGAKLVVDLHLIHGNSNRLQNPIRIIRGLQLEVEDVVFTGLASALALLSNEQKELGALVIDIGGGTTEYVVYAGGIVKHTGVLAVGGDHVSNDIGYGLKLPLSRAEQLKIEYGGAFIHEAMNCQAINISNDLGLPMRSVNIDHLRRIMAARLEEIFELIEQDLSNKGCFDDLRAGAFICGGCSRIRSIDRLAEQILGVPAHIARTNSMNGLKSALDQPEFATAIGLTKYGSFQHKRRTSGGLLGGLTTFFKRQAST